ncbi:MAG: DUF4292 domain-containing protein [Ferruginibacter sp.]|nr:DUF4292 domain-containing protein [Ferruginibacter sp.]
MKYFFPLGLFFLSIALYSCKTTRQINKAIAPKDSTTVFDKKSSEDSLKLINETVNAFKANYIDFKTFSAKIKVDVEDSKGKQPDITAVVRIIKDSAIWVSLSATLFNVEVYRVLITKDSVILLNKQEREVQYRSLDYLQEVAQLPVDFVTLQNLLVGNPVFYNDSIMTYRQIGDFILLGTVGNVFKNLLTLNAGNKLLTHIKLDDIDISRNRTADITYDNYENNSGFNFSTSRQIIASEKNKLDLRLNFKQYEFNKELSVSFNIPRNYKIK